MAGQSRKWMILVATIWLQAFTGTNFDFSAYSSEMKAVLGVSQVQLNYLATASDLGKALGWSSGLALMYMPVWMVMFLAAFMGLVGYGVQYLVILKLISLPYFAVFILCLLAGSSICWFNTVCFVLCIRNFPSSRPLALALTVSFNGVSAALYNLAANALDPSSPSFYLLLNAFTPLIVSFMALVPILRQPDLHPQQLDRTKRDQFSFLVLNFLAVITGLYLLLLHSSNLITAQILFSGAITLLVIPLGIPGIIYAREWFKRTVYSSFHFEDSSTSFLLVDHEDLELHKEQSSRQNSTMSEGSIVGGRSEMPISPSYYGLSPWKSADGVGNFQKWSSREGLMETDKLITLGEEHQAGVLVHRLDFWLYYATYFCGGTIGLVYSNNLGQIAHSLGQSSMTSTLITLYSSFSFFGRLCSALPDYIRTKFYFSRTGWLAMALLPTPIAFFLLAAASDSNIGLQAGTSLIGLSSGFIFSAAVSITSELFGPNSVGVNHNILITNIPIGSLVYGYLAAIVYDSNSDTSGKDCIGKRCYFMTFFSWGCISIVGLLSSVVLFIRTRPIYDRFEKRRTSPILY